MTRCGAVTPLVRRWKAVNGDLVGYGNVEATHWARVVHVGTVVFERAGHWCADHCHIIGADDLGSVTVSQ